MSLLGRFFLWRAKRRHAAHKRWAREARVTFTFTSPPTPDDRDWQGKFTRSRKP